MERGLPRTFLWHQSGHDTVAEGIEQIKQMTELRSVGCRLGQGFLFAWPMRAEAVGTLLQRGAQASAENTDADLSFAESAADRTS